MAKPKVLILRTAGINCDRETEFAFQLAGAAVTLAHINHLKKKSDFSRYQIICIPGGFSYGDDLGAGKIFSLEFLLWFKDAVKKFIENNGAMIGICNGFQILVKTGILPDLSFQQKVTLTDNESARFEDRWVYLKPNTDNKSLWLKNLPERIVLPVAHGEGKFYADQQTLAAVKPYAAFRYVDKQGNFAEYPLNPNGSLDDIAGITDKTGRILGLMPHPERCIFKHHLPQWQTQKQTPYGLIIFKNAVEYFKKFKS